MLHRTNVSGTAESLLLKWNCFDRFYGQIVSVPAYRLNGLFLVLTNIATGLFSTSFNSLVVYVFFKNKNLRDVSHILAVMLSTGDLLAASCQMLFVARHGYTAFKPENIQTTIYCYLRTAEILMQAISLQVSIITIFGITLNRYMAVFSPHSYNNKCKRTVFRAMGVLSVPCTIFMSLFISSKYLIIPASMLLLGLISSILVFCVYAYVKIHKRIQISLKTAGVENQKNVARQRKRYITALLVVIVYFLCYFPCSITGSVLLLDLDRTGIIDAYVLPWLSTLFYTSSSANPFIYCLRNFQLGPIIRSYFNMSACFSRLTAHNSPPEIAASSR